MENVILNRQQVTFDEADHHFEVSAVNDHLLHLLAYAARAHCIRLCRGQSKSKSTPMRQWLLAVRVKRLMRQS